MEVQQRDISSRGYVFVEERRFLEPVRPKTVIVNNTIINKTVNITKIKVVNKTVINEGPSTTVIEQVSGRKVQAVPVRELRRKEEAAVVTKQRIAPSSNEKNVPAPVRSEVEPSGKKVVPAQEPGRIQRPTATTTGLQPAATKKDIRQSDEQNRAAKLAAEQRARQETARATESEKGRLAAERRAVIQEQKEQKAAEKRAKQQQNKRTKEEQAADERSRKNAAKEDQNKKGNEPEASPENPDVSPQSPH